jgi:hypothetical protein
MVKIVRPFVVFAVIAFLTYSYINGSSGWISDLVHKIPEVAAVTVSKPTATPKPSSKPTATPTQAGLKGVLQAKANDIGGSVLGIANYYVQQVASQSALTIQDFVIDHGMDIILKQYDKLPAAEKAKVRGYMCK